MIYTTSKDKQEELGGEGYTVVRLLLKGEILEKTNATKAQFNGYLEDGMPHYLLGNEYRFLECEVLNWLET